MKVSSKGDNNDVWLGIIDSHTQSEGFKGLGKKDLRNSNVASGEVNQRTSDFVQTFLCHTFFSLYKFK